MLPGLKVGAGVLVGVDSPCVCNESLDALSERAVCGHCIPADLNTLAGAGKASVRLAKLVGDALGNDVADLVRSCREEGPQLLKGEKLLFGCQEARSCVLVFVCLFAEADVDGTRGTWRRRRRRGRGRQQREERRET